MATKTKTKKKSVTEKIKRAAALRAPVKKRLTKAQKLQREIAKRNKLFAAASAAEKRVLIAKDVIAQIKLGRYKAYAQAWVRPEVRVGGKPRSYVDLSLEFGPDAPVRELFLNNKIASCDCCALGAMFMSCTLYNNNQTTKDFEDELLWFDELVEGVDGGFSNGLNKFFSADQLMLIESAFEGGTGAFAVPVDQAKKKSVLAWHDKLSDDKKRLVAIMENIIENKGTFKP